jgi:flagellar motor switch protein FliG
MEHVSQIVRGGAPPGLTRRQKAAVIVRLLLDQGTTVPLSLLTDDQQVGLTEAMGQLRTIDHATLRNVVEEFAADLDAVGLSFPGGIDGALGVLEGHISEATASRLRRQAVLAGRSDPWARIVTLPTPRLLALLEAEAVEVGAVILSKLVVNRAAELMGELPGDRARRLARAIADTARVPPDTVRRIGLALLQQVDSDPDNAFPAPPVQRVGAILNHSAAAMRDAVLDGLEAEDAAFAAELRRAILTFRDLPARLEPRDVPKLLREVAPADLTLALAAATDPADARAADFLLAAMSQRMAAQLRDQAAERGTPKPKDGETAMSAVVAALRTLEGRGEIVLLPPPE